MRVWLTIWKFSKISAAVVCLVLSFAVALLLTLLSGFLFLTIVGIPLGILMFFGAWSVPGLFVALLVELTKRPKVYV
jgi:hypothetical protein